MGESPAKKIVIARVHPDVDAEVRSIANREGETQSTIIRRLLRLGLDAARRADAGEVARRG